METREIEKYVDEQIKLSPVLSQLSDERQLCFAVVGLNEEAGEVGGLLSREVYKGRDIPQSKWLEELGDVLWYLVAACRSKGFTLEELVQYNKQKLEDRYGELK